MTRFQMYLEMVHFTVKGAYCIVTNQVKLMVMEYEGVNFKQCKGVCHAYFLIIRCNFVNIEDVCNTKKMAILDDLSSLSNYVEA